MSWGKRLVFAQSHSGGWGSPNNPMGGKAPALSSPRAVTGGPEGDARRHEPTARLPRSTVQTEGGCYF